MQRAERPVHLSVHSSRLPSLVALSVHQSSHLPPTHPSLCLSRQQTLTKATLDHVLGLTPGLRNEQQAGSLTGSLTGWAPSQSAPSPRLAPQGVSESVCFLILVVLIRELTEPQLGLLRGGTGYVFLGGLGKVSLVESIDWTKV